MYHSVFEYIAYADGTPGCKRSFLSVLFSPLCGQTKSIIFLVSITNSVNNR